METIISKTSPARFPVQRTLLICGISSSLYCVALNIFIPMYYPGYDPASYTVSELSAIGSPTRTMWVWLCTLYTLQVTVFGWAVWRSAISNKPLRVTGILLLAYGIFNSYWPPMHQRQVLAAGGGTLTDTMHLVYAGVTVALMITSMSFGAAAFGWRFRWYTLATILLLALFGALTGADAPKVQANEPTPYAGIWERINVGLFLLWVIVLSLIMLSKTGSNPAQTNKYQ